MSSLPVSFASICHSKSCINGVCKESNECNITQTNTSGGASKTTPTGKTLNDDTPVSPSLTSSNDPLAELVAWIQSILDSIFK